MKSHGLILLAVLIALLLPASCSKEGENQTDENALDCKGNRAPEVGGPYIVKNNLPVDDPNATFAVDEIIGIAIDFRDKDCNLAGGKIWAAITEEGTTPTADDYQPIVYIPKWADCEGTVDDKSKLGFDVRLNSGNRLVSVGLEDACGAKSENAVDIVVKVRN